MSEDGESLKAMFGGGKILRKEIELIKEKVNKKKINIKLINYFYILF